MKLDDKFMELKLKAGFTLCELIEILEINSEEEFWQIINRNFTADAVKYYRLRLKRNEKQKNKSQRRKKDNKVILPPQKPEVIAAESCNGKDIIEEKSSDNLTNPNKELEDLKKSEEEIVQFLIDQEIEHKKLVSGRLEIRKKLKEYESSLLEARRRVSALEIATTEAAKELEMINSGMEETNQLRREAKAELEEVRRAIKEKERISILVYENGELEMSVPSDVPDDWKEIYARLTGTTELAGRIEELTLKQIKLLSQCLAIRDEFNATGKDFEFIFENEAMTQAFATY